MAAAACDAASAASSAAAAPAQHVRGGVGAAGVAASRFSFSAEDSRLPDNILPVPSTIQTINQLQRDRLSSDDLPAPDPAARRSTINWGAAHHPPPPPPQQLQQQRAAAAAAGGKSSSGGVELASAAPRPMAHS